MPLLPLCVQAKPSHSKGLELIVAPPPTRIFKHSYGPAMVHSALPRNGDDVYHNETNDFTESDLFMLIRVSVVTLFWVATHKNYAAT